MASIEFRLLILFLVLALPESLQLVKARALGPFIDTAF
jgi:hypothetical protein